MRDPNGKDLDTFPSAMGVITRLACELAKHQGVEVDLPLRKAGLTREQIDDPRARLPVKSQIRFVELAAKALDDEYLGFHLAQKFDLRMGGLFHYVLASSDTLGEAFQRGARYSAILNEGITLRLREGKGIGSISNMPGFRGIPTAIRSSLRLWCLLHMPKIDKSSLAGEPGESHSSTEK